METLVGKILLRHKPNVAVPIHRDIILCRKINITIIEVKHPPCIEKIKTKLTGLIVKMYVHMFARQCPLVRQTSVFVRCWPFRTDSEQHATACKTFYVIGKCSLCVVEAKVIGTHVTKFFCADKFVWLKEKGKPQNMSFGLQQNRPNLHSYSSRLWQGSRYKIG